MAEWWFTGSSAGATWASFKRATTTSFGSICFGSLFLSVVRAAHQMLQEMRKSENNACVCLAGCLLQCIDAVATYFNRYAFTYVAMYGTSFVESGKEAFNLFHQRGLDAIINDQLISNVFTLMAFGSGVLVALVGYGFALVRPCVGAAVCRFLSWDRPTFQIQHTTTTHMHNHRPSTSRAATAG